MQQFLQRNFGLVILLAVTLFGGFFVGSLWKENQIIKTGTTNTLGAQQPGANDNAPVAPQGPSQDQLSKVPEVTRADYDRGASNPKITLIEYSDLECPFCKSFHPTMQQVVDEYGDQVSWVYRHFPLTFHVNAQKAAETSECVGKLGGETAFWQFIDAYFAETTSNGTGVALDEMAPLAARSAGVSQTAVQTCLDNDEMAQKVKDQISTGGAAGVSGTPGTIVITSDGQHDFISGALPYEQVKQVVEKYL